MLERVAGTISRYNMLRPGHRVGVAVSGGADSVCLLYVLRALAPRLGVSLTVLHLDHKLRGAESDADADFVRALAGNLGLPFVGESADVSLMDENVEQAGRRARSAFYGRLIEAGCLDRVATGHSRSDQAETVLYRLLRGSGTAGISGIAPFTRDGIVRPLIDCSRDEIEAYLTQQAIAWREDSTNRETRFARNRIRHDLLPSLALDYNPAVADVLARMAAVARDEEEYWDSEIEHVFARLVRGSGSKLVLATREFIELHPAVQRRLIRRVIKEVKGDLRGMGIEHIEQISMLAARATGNGRVNVPGVEVWRSFDWLRFAIPGKVGGYWFPVRPPVRLTLPEAGSLVIDIVEISSPGEHRYYNGVSVLDYDRLCGPLAIRNWRPGDRYSPQGDVEKIKQLFQRARIPSWERQSWPIMTSDDKIVWAKRFGTAAEAAPHANTRKILRLREEPGGDSSESNRSGKASE